MPPSDTAISVRGLAKSYTIRHDQQKHSTLAESLLARLMTPLRRQTAETFWALREINFDVSSGEVVGVIGRNGAGKSTLLKILSRITEPTEGTIDLYGRIGSLLEVGTGFHPELTGRENIFLNGAILGMKRGEIQRQFDAIVEFAGVEQFLDTPVKRFSSGMYVRLAFAVAAHLNPEILIIDEVLAVGDAEFQAKCLGKMKDVAAGGRTVLFVSHNMAAVRGLCSRALLLVNGKVVVDGGADAVVDEYVALCNHAATTSVAQRTDRRGEGGTRFIDAKAQALTVGRPAEIVFVLSGWTAGLNVVFTIYDLLGQPVAHCATHAASAEDEINRPTTPTFEVAWHTDQWLLAPGQYRVNAAVYSGQTLQDHLEGIVALQVEPGSLCGRAVTHGGGYGSVALPHRWIVRDSALR